MTAIRLSLQVYAPSYVNVVVTHVDGFNSINHNISSFQPQLKLEVAFTFFKIKNLLSLTSKCSFRILSNTWMFAISLESFWCSIISFWIAQETVSLSKYRNSIWSFYVSPKSFPEFMYNTVISTLHDGQHCYCAADGKTPVSASPLAKADRSSTKTISDSIYHLPIFLALTY